MIKAKYEQMEMEVIDFEVDDIIVTSGDQSIKSGRYETPLVNIDE